MEVNETFHLLNHKPLSAKRLFHSLLLASLFFFVGFKAHKLLASRPQNALLSHVKIMELASQL